MFKNILYKVVVVIVIAVTVLSSCGTSKRKQTAKSGAWSRDYRVEYNQRLSHNDRRINDLKISNHRDRVSAIEARNYNLKRKLDSFKANSRNEWEYFRREFNRDLKSIDKSIRDFNKENKKSKNSNNRQKSRRR
jgi:hypothetical protein